MALRAVYQVASWHVTVGNGGTKTITGVAYTAGDRLALVVGGENATVGTVTSVTGGTGLTWTAVSAGTLTTGTDTECSIFLYNAVAASTQTGQTITITKGTGGSGQIGGIIFVNTGDGGALTNVATSRTEAKFTAFTPAAGATVVVAIADWAAGSGVTFDVGTGTMTERCDVGNATTYGFWAADWAGVTATSTQFGLQTSPSNFYSGKTVSQSIFVFPPVSSGDVNGAAVATLGAPTTVVVGSPAGTAAASSTFGATAAGTVVSAVVNGTAASSVTFGAVAAGTATGMSYGSAGTGTAASGASPMTVATTTTLNVGDLFHVVMAYDNSGTSGADPVTGQMTASPASGAFGTVLSQQSFLNDPGAASGGLAIRDALYPVTTQVASGTNISLAWSGTVVLRSVTFTRIWTSTPNATLGFVSAAGTLTITNQVATATPAWTTSSVTANDFLLCFGGLEWGSAVPGGDSDTASGTWGTAHGQNNGVNSALGMSTVVQAKRVTATATQTWNPTGTASDWILGGVIIRETVLADANGTATATLGAPTATVVGSPAGSVAASMSVGANAAGTVTSAVVNGTAAAALSSAAVVVGSPAGTVVRVHGFTAAVTAQMAIQGSAVATLSGPTAVVVGTVGVAGSAAAVLGSSAVVVGSPAGAAVAVFGTSVVVAGQMAWQGVGAAPLVWGAVAQGGPAGTASSNMSLSVVAAGAGGVADANGVATAALGRPNPVVVGSPAGFSASNVAFSASVVAQMAVQGSANTNFGLTGAVVGRVDVGGAAVAALGRPTAVVVGAPAGSAVRVHGFSAIVAGSLAIAGSAVANLGFSNSVVGVPAGSVSSTFGLSAVASGSGTDPNIYGAAAAALGGTGTVVGSPAAQGSAVAALGVSATVIGQVAGTVTAATGFGASAVGTTVSSGQVVAATGFAAAVGGTPTVVGTAVASVTFSSATQGGPAGVATSSMALGAVAVGRVTVIGQVTVAVGFGVATFGDAPVEGGGGGTHLWYDRAEGNRADGGTQWPNPLPHKVRVPKPVPARG